MLSMDGEIFHIYLYSKFVL